MLQEFALKLDQVTIYCQSLRINIMKSKQTMFFLLLEDITHILQDIEAVVDIRYSKTGLFDSNSIPEYNSIFDTPNPGVTYSGDWNRIDSYLILKKKTPLNIREVPQN